MTTETTATDTRELIIESAFDCFRRHGLDKTTVVDIARAADVSRSTVYEYFRDKAEIVEACAEACFAEVLPRDGQGDAQGRDAGGPAGSRGGFRDQGPTVRRARGRTSTQDEVSLLLTKNAAVLLRECGEFLAPYLAAAKLTGEVRKDLDVAAAGEWFARMLFSLFSTPSATLNWTMTRSSPNSCGRMWSADSPHRPDPPSVKLRREVGAKNSPLFHWAKVRLSAAVTPATSASRRQTSHCPLNCVLTVQFRDTRRPRPTRSGRGTDCEPCAVGHEWGNPAVSPGRVRSLSHRGVRSMSALSNHRA